MIGFCSINLKYDILLELLRAWIYSRIFSPWSAGCQLICISCWITLEQMKYKTADCLWTGLTEMALAPSICMLQTLFTSQKIVYDIGNPIIWVRSVAWTLMELWLFPWGLYNLNAIKTKKIILQIYLKKYILVISGTIPLRFYKFNPEWY